MALAIAEKTPANLYSRVTQLAPVQRDKDLGTLKVKEDAIIVFSISALLVELEKLVSSLYFQESGLRGGKWENLDIHIDENNSHVKQMIEEHEALLLGSSSEKDRDALQKYRQKRSHVLVNGNRLYKSVLKRYFTKEV